MSAPVRDTIATRQRVKNIKKLIAQFQLQDMLADDVIEFLNLSTTGARRYINDLLNDRVITIWRYIDSRQGFIGYPLYRLVMCRTKLDRYITDLGDDDPCIKPKRKLNKKPAPEGTHVYLCGDDVTFDRMYKSRPRGKHPLVHEAFFGKLAA